MEGQWAAPHFLGKEVNSFKTHWQFSIATNENLYLSVNDTIMISVFDGKAHLKPKPLKLQNNTNMQGMMPYIAPDESYILYSIRKNKADKFSDLYISYRLKNGKWTDPVNLGSDINTAKNEYLPIVSGDGKYLFFVSNREEGDFLRFWVSAKIIEKLKPKELK